jgi:hypothetical protein
MKPQSPLSEPKRQGKENEYNREHNPPGDMHRKRERKQEKEKIDRKIRREIVIESEVLGKEGVALQKSLFDMNPEEVTGVVLEREIGVEPDRENG